MLPFVLVFYIKGNITGFLQMRINATDFMYFLFCCFDIVSCNSLLIQVMSHLLLVILLLLVVRLRWVLCLRGTFLTNLFHFIRKCALKRFELDSQDVKIITIYHTFNTCMLYYYSVRIVHVICFTNCHIRVCLNYEIYFFQFMKMCFFVSHGFSILFFFLIM